MKQPTRATVFVAHSLGGKLKLGLISPELGLVSANTTSYSLGIIAKEVSSTGNEMERYVYGAESFNFRCFDEPEVMKMLEFVRSETM
jgi:hypothetical protein